MSNLTEIHTVCIEFFHEDRHGEANGRFNNFANLVKNLQHEMIVSGKV
jgi:hypothetical protein